MNTPKKVKPGRCVFCFSREKNSLRELPLSAVAVNSSGALFYPNEDGRQVLNILWMVLKQLLNNIYHHKPDTYTNVP